jgi:hypothetical protein
MHWSGQEAGRARAFSYDRARGRLLPLLGEVRLSPSTRGPG